MRKFLALKKPCADCPFTIDSSVDLNADRRDEIAESLLGDGTFYCHKTVDYSPEEPSTARSSRCFGAASVFYKSTGQQSQLERIAERMGGGLVDLDSYDTPLTYADLDDFVANGH